MRKHHSGQHNILQSLQAPDAGGQNAADEVEHEADSGQPPRERDEDYEPEEKIATAFDVTHCIRRG